MSEVLTYLHWSTIPTRRLSMLQPTPAEISVNLTPCWMARVVPSLGDTSRVLTRSDLAPTRMHLFPARWSLEDREDRQARLLSEQ